MKKDSFQYFHGGILFSCNSDQKDPAAAATDSSNAMAPATSTADLPYIAEFSSSFNTRDVSDADLKTVLMSYKNWEDGNLTELAKEMADTITGRYEQWRASYKDQCRSFENVDYLSR